MCVCVPYTNVNQVFFCALLPISFCTRLYFILHFFLSILYFVFLMMMMMNI